MNGEHGRPEDSSEIPSFSDQEYQRVSFNVSLTERDCMTGVFILEEQDSMGWDNGNVLESHQPNRFFLKAVMCWGLVIDSQPTDSSFLKFVSKFNGEVQEPR